MRRSTVTPRECAELLLTTVPGLMRGIVADLRQRKGGDEAQHPAQIRLLHLLGCQPQTLRELAAHHHVTPSTMSRTIDGLVQRGWVARRDNPRDRREVILSLTDAGRAAMDDMHARMQETVAAVLGRLSADDLARLYDGLRVLEPLVASEGPAGEGQRRDDPSARPSNREHESESVTP